MVSSVPCRSKCCCRVIVVDAVSICSVGFYVTKLVAWSLSCAVRSTALDAMCRCGRYFLGGAFSTGLFQSRSSLGFPCCSENL